MTFNVVNSKGVSIPKARKPIRIVHWTPTWNCNYLLFNLGGFLRLFPERSMLTGTIFTLSEMEMEIWGLDVKNGVYLQE